MAMPIKQRRVRTPAAPWLALALLVAAAGCNRKEPPAPVVAAPPSTVEDTGFLQSVPIGLTGVDRPWITHVNPVDLDHDGRIDVLACDTKANTVVWLRQQPDSTFVESVLADGLAAPVHVEAVDIDGDKDLDLLVACMGVVYPNNDKIGSIIILENDGHEHFTKHVIAENIARVTDVRAGDFNGDGKPDLAVAQFGYDQGEIQWMENLGNWNFRGHPLLNKSGTINVCVADLNGDGTPDIAAVVSQQWEEIHLFENKGGEQFTDRIIFGSTNEDFGSSGISLCDLNRDGRPDILYTNGDGFDYSAPGARAWHGVQWLENAGQGFFRFHRVGDLAGAYSPVGVDLDGDGAIDIVATSDFANWGNPASASLVYFRNDGKMNFTKHVLAHAPTHLVTCAAADLDGNGRPVLVTGGFHTYPPFDRMSRVTLWRRSAAGK